MDELCLPIPEIDYALPIADGEHIALFFPVDWLSFVVATLTEITESEFHTGGESLYAENRQKIDAVLDAIISNEGWLLELAGRSELGISTYLY